MKLFEFKLALFTFGIAVIWILVGCMLWSTSCFADNVTKMVISDYDDEVWATLPFSSVDQCRHHANSMAIIIALIEKHRAKIGNPVYVTCTPIPHGPSEAL